MMISTDYLKTVKYFTCFNSDKCKQHTVYYDSQPHVDI